MSAPLRNVLVAATLFISPLFATEEETRARSLLEAGQTSEAFLAFLALPGGEFAAAHIAREDPRSFLATIKRLQPTLATSLIEGDLHWAAGDKEAALACYRRAQTLAADSTSTYPYVVEPPAQTSDPFSSQPIPTRRSEPFHFGPGSHRDNWLIRRLIAAEAWPEAAIEFDRVWQIHRSTRPLDGITLLFALDYAFFLLDRKQTDAALGTLLDPLLQLDLDRPFGFHRFSEREAGSSPQDFTRLAYGVFHKEGRAEELVGAVQKQIDLGDNRARRVLARIRLLQGKLEEGLRLELDYVDAAKLNTAATEFRRGVAYHEAHHNAEAIACFERVLAAAEDSDNIPFEDDGIQSSALRLPFAPRSAKSASRIRLRTLYGGAGVHDKMLPLLLQEADQFTEANLHSERSLRDLASTFRAAGQEETFRQWLETKTRTTTNPRAKAQFFLALDQFDEAIAVLSSLTGMSRDEVNFWLGQLSRGEPGLRQKFLESVRKADPANTYVQLLLSQNASQDTQIAALESVLQDPEPRHHSRGGEDNPFHQAYRLMRLYESVGSRVKMESLAVRIARSEKPFEVDADQFRYRDVVSTPELANAALAISLTNPVNPAEVATSALAGALATSSWVGARAQLVRVTNPNAAQPRPPATIPWSNVPANCQLFVSDENVLALARDDQFVYSGHPWGVGVWTAEGALIRRILLGDAARALVVLGDSLWAGTPKGLFRVQRGDWNVAHHWLNEDIPAFRRDKPNAKSPYNYRSETSVNTLAADGVQLWIGMDRTIQVLNTETLALRAYSWEELGCTNNIDCERIIPTGKHVWAIGDETYQFTRENERWRKLEPKGVENAQMIGVSEGKVFGSVYLGDPLRNRPCYIDADTLAITPISLEGDDKGKLINTPFRLLETSDGAPLLQAGEYCFKLHAGVDGPSAQRLTDPANAPANRHYDELDPLGEIKSFLTARKNAKVPKPLPEEWQTVSLTDGTQVFGLAQDRIRYKYYEDRSDDYREVKIPQGGLIFVFPDGEMRRVSAPSYTGGLPGDRVFAHLRDDQTLWICCNGGLVAQTPDAFHVFTRVDGLCANRITGAVLTPKGPWFSSGWGDSGGGLIFWNRDKHLFESFFDLDGLATNKLRTIFPEGDCVRLVYDTEYLRHQSGKFRRFPAGRFYPAELRFESEGEAIPAGREEPPLPPMPILGGYTISSARDEGKTWLYGSRGMLVMNDAEAAPELKLIALQARLIQDEEVTQQNEARIRNAKLTRPSDIIAALDDPNPFYRAKVLEGPWKLTPEIYPSVVSQLEHANRRVRGTALIKLQRAKLPDELALPAFEKATKDPERQIRGIAVLELLKRGQRPDFPLLEEFFTAGHSELQYGMDSRMGNLASKEAFYTACAAQADDAIFGLLLSAPPSWSAHDYKSTIFPKLGESLTRHPEAVDRLLGAYGERQCEFAAGVFRFAGPALLPKLQEALQSKERVIRSNAAVACGEIGNPDSIAPLIAALDFPSGLVQASVVEALGKLRAKEALPVLQTLYLDVRNDEQRTAGFHTSQAFDATSSQYSSIRSLQSVEREWDQLKPAGPARPLDPLANENLLKSADILQALSAIGPEHSQEFYRKLAAEKNVEGRVAASRALAVGSEEDRTLNLPILLTLRNDPAPQVRIPAAVSLILLGNHESDILVLDWLKSDDDWLARELLREFERLPDPGSLAFASDALTTASTNPKLSPGSRDRATKLLRRLTSPPPQPK